MENTEFIRKIIELYQEARKSRFSDEKIKRGRSHTISSLVEDLFAKYLAEEIDCDEILVDSPIKVDGCKKMFYPDIAVVRKREIVCTFDLKMDMGYVRDRMIPLYNEASENVKKFRGKACHTNVMKDNLIEKEERTYAFSKKLKHFFVVISGRNIGDKKKKAILNNREKCNLNVQIFVLTDKKHPGEYGYEVKALMKEIDRSDENFTNILHQVNNL